MDGPPGYPKARWKPDCGILHTTGWHNSIALDLNSYIASRSFQTSTRSSSFRPLSLEKASTQGSGILCSFEVNISSGSTSALIYLQPLKIPTCIQSFTPFRLCQCRIAIVCNGSQRNPRINQSLLKRQHLILQVHDFIRRPAISSISFRSE